MSRMHPDARAAARAEPLSLCTIGDLILDVIVLPDRPLAPDADTPATIRLAAGGQAANVAAWASALGATQPADLQAGHRRRRASWRPPSSRATASRSAARWWRAAAASSSRSATPTASGRWPPTAAWPRCSTAPSSTPRGCSRATCSTCRATACCASRWREAAIEAARLARRVTVDLASAHDIEIARRPAVRRAAERPRPGSRLRHRGRAGRGARLRRRRG